MSPPLLSGGGPTRNIMSLASHVSEFGNSVSILSDMPEISVDDRLILPSSKKVNLKLVSNKHSCRIRNITNLQLRHELTKMIMNSRDPIIHENGIWTPRHNSIVRVAQSGKIPLVISPRGMLQPWALNYKKYKKRLAWFLYQRKNLEAATVFHAASTSEFDAIRQCGLKQPVAVIPNGVNLSHKGFNLKKVSMPASSSNGNGYKTALYLGRVHPSKGLMTLLKSWKIAKPQGWRLKIVGPNELSHKEELKKEIIKYKLDAEIHILDAVDGNERDRYYSEANLFILPSYSENFGIVVAEALSFGVPVITTTGTPWSDLQAKNCGWWVTPDEKGITSALVSATVMDEDKLIEMGERGRRWVQVFHWDKIGLEFDALYRWVAGKGDIPANLHF